MSPPGTSSILSNNFYTVHSRRNLIDFLPHQLEYIFIVNQFLDEITSHAWAAWLAFSFLCGILELILPSFSFVFAALSASLTALIATQTNISVQLISFSAFLILSLFLIRPRFIAKIHYSKELPSRTQVLVGKTGHVIEDIDSTNGTGRVTVEGLDWAAQSSLLITKGKTIVIEGSDGIVLKVKEV